MNKLIEDIENNPIINEAISYYSTHPNHMRECEMMKELVSLLQQASEALKACEQDTVDRCVERIKKISGKLGERSEGVWIKANEAINAIRDAKQ